MKSFKKTFVSPNTNSDISPELAEKLTLEIGPTLKYNVSIEDTAFFKKIAGSFNPPEPVQEEIVDEEIQDYQEFKKKQTRREVVSSKVNKVYLSEGVEIHIDSNLNLTGEDIVKLIQNSNF